MPGLPSSAYEREQIFAQLVANSGAVRKRTTEHVKDLGVEWTI
jgi:hypothetical protein